MKTNQAASLLAPATVALSLAAPLPAAAQSLDSFERETRVEGAITIPLGASTDRRRASPRFEIISRTRAPSDSLVVVARQDAQRWQERRIGLTLDGTHTLMVNARPVAFDDQKDTISPLGIAGIAAGTVALFYGVVFLASVDDIAEASE